MTEAESREIVDNIKEIIEKVYVNVCCCRCCEPAAVEEGSLLRYKSETQYKSANYL